MIVALPGFFSDLFFFFFFFFFFLMNSVIDGVSESMLNMQP